MKKFSALLLVLCLLIGVLAGCGGTASNVEASATAPASESEAPAVQEEVPAPEPEPEPVASVEEPSVVEEPVEPAVTIEYPIPGENNVLTMIECMRNHAAAVLGDGDFSDQYVYPELAKRTGVEIQFDMIAETAFTERLNLIIVSQDYPDIFGQGIGTYDTNPMKAIADDVVIDIAPLLADNAPDYYALIQNNEDFADSITNSDGTICKITSCNIGIQSQGLFIRGDWLEALDLEVPTTIDEMTQVLTAFHEANNTPMSLLVNADLDDGLAGVFDHSNVGFTRQMLGFQQTEPNSGKVICAMASDGYFEHSTLTPGNTMLRNLSLWEGAVMGSQCHRCAAGHSSRAKSVFRSHCGVGAAVVKSGYTVEYPLDTDVPLTMIAKLEFMMQNLISNFGDVLAMQQYMQDTGVNMEFTMLGDSVFDDQLNLLIAADDLPDMIQGGIAGYGIKLSAAIEDEVLMDILPLLPEYAPDYYQYIAGDKTFRENVLNDDGTTSMFAGVSLSADETEKVYSMAVDVLTLFSTDASAYVMGTLDEAGFKQTVENAMGMGLAEITEIYQAAYDSYMAEQ